MPQQAVRGKGRAHVTPAWGAVAAGTSSVHHLFRRNQGRIGLIRASMLSPDRSAVSKPVFHRFRSHGLSPSNIAVLFSALTLLISIPIWTHPLPPLSDYVNHLARMHVIATLPDNPLLAN